MYDSHWLIKADKPETGQEVAWENQTENDQKKEDGIRKDLVAQGSRHARRWVKPLAT